MKAILILFLLLTLVSAAKAENAGISLNATIEGRLSEVARIQKILPGLKKVINSEAFKKRILEAKFKDTKDSSEEILKKILKSDWDLKYKFETQKTWLGKCPVLGWTYPSTKTVWFNRCNFAPRKDNGIAGTMAHEQMHKLGYGHKSAKSYQSVPYSIGTIVSELYEKNKIRRKNQSWKI